MDLHDGVIQSIYAVGLHLEDCSDRLPANAQDVKGDVEQAIDDLNKVSGRARRLIIIVATCSRHGKKHQTQDYRRAQQEERAGRRKHRGDLRGGRPGARRRL